MGPQPRPNPCPIPAPLNEGLSIDTTSPMTSIHFLQEVYGHKAEKMRQKSLKHPQALALSSDDVLSSPLVPHVGQKRLQVLPQILLMPLPRLSALDTMDPLDRLGHLQSCCQIQFLKQRKVTRSMSLVLCVPRSSHKPTVKSQWLPTGNTSILFIIGSLGCSFLWRQFLVRYTEGKNGIDNLLDFLEWFTKY